MLEEGIAGAQKVVIPGAAHMVPMEQPDMFNRLVLDFLRAVDEDR
jgi:pimeloyl-ACP methyl ester carboxylesterase